MPCIGPCSRDTFAPLDNRLAHANRARNAVQLLVEAAGVADVIALLVASPEGSCRRAAIVTLEGTKSATSSLKTAAASQLTGRWGGTTT